MAVAFPEAVPLPELTNQNCLSFEEARSSIKAKFASYKQLLDRKELELLSELDQLEETNKPELTQVQHDIDQLDGVMKKMDDSLGANTLKPFLEEQKNLLNKQISHFQNCRNLLSHVTLDASNLKYFITNLVKIIPFISKANFRVKLAPILELEPEEEEEWNVVSISWFSDFCDSINFNNPLPNDSWEFPEQIPIDQSGIYTDGKIDPAKIKLLHSNAWNMLLEFNGLKFGSKTISRRTFYNEDTGIVEVPLIPVTHRCILRHISKNGTKAFNSEINISCYPSETYEELIYKLMSFNKYFDIINSAVFAFDRSYTITGNSPHFNSYTVNRTIQPTLDQPTPNTLPLVQPSYNFTQRNFSGSNLVRNQTFPVPTPLSPLAPIQDTDTTVGFNSQSILFAIPDSDGNTNIQVVSYLPELK